MCNGPWEKAQRVLAIFGDMWNKCQLGLGHELDKIPHIYLGLRLPEILWIWDLLDEYSDDISEIQMD